MICGGSSRCEHCWIVLAGSPQWGGEVVAKSDSILAGKQDAHVKLKIHIDDLITVGYSESEWAGDPSSSKLEQWSYGGRRLSIDVICSKANLCGNEQ